MAGKRNTIILSMSEKEAWAIVGQPQAHDGNGEKTKQKVIEKIYKLLEKTREPRLLGGFRNYPDGNVSKNPDKRT